MDRNRDTIQLKDVDLVSEGVNLPCHKLLLALHSPYFRTFFSSGFPESREKEIEMIFIKPKILKLVEVFINTGNFRVKKKDLKDVLDAFTFLLLEDKDGKLHKNIENFKMTGKELKKALKTGPKWLDEANLKQRMIEDYKFLNNLPNGNQSSRRKMKSCSVACKKLQFEM